MCAFACVSLGCDCEELCAFACVSLGCDCKELCAFLFAAALRFHYFRSRMRRIIHIVHSIYAFAVFIVLFILLLPFYMLFIQKESWHPAALFLNRIWANLFFPMTFLPVDQELRFKPQHGKRYIFCPNHTSYMDIPVMGLIPHHFVFVGKSSIEKV